MRKFAISLFLMLGFLFTLSFAYAGDGCGCAESICTGNSVSYTRDGLTIGFEFNCDGDQCACGQFANGWDYWVAPLDLEGTVTITRMYPDMIGSDSSLRHGAMADPMRMDQQGFHGGAIANNILMPVSPETVVAPPYAVNPDALGRPSVLIKSIAREDDACQSPSRQCIAYYETLTIVQEPPGAVFRPPFFGTEKPMVPLSNFDDSILSSVTDPAGLMSWDDAVRSVQSPNIAPMTTFRQAGQGLHAQVNNQTSRGYDGHVVRQLNGALMRLAVKADGSDAAKKRALALGVAQMGIDLYHIHKNGAASDYAGYGDFTSVPCGAWPAAGGFNGGRLTPIVFSAVLLGMNEWLETLNLNLATRDGQQCFSETGFIQANEQRRGKGIPTFGHLNTALYTNVGDCGGNNRNCASVGGRSTPSYDFYDGLADGDPLSNTGSPTAYQRCCTLNAWLGAALVSWLTPAVMDVYPENARHWLDFMDRSKRQGDTTGDGDFGSYDDPSSDRFTTFRATAYESPGAVPMWIAHRDCIRNGNCAGAGASVRPNPPTTITVE